MKRLSIIVMSCVVLIAAGWCLFSTLLKHPVLQIYVSNRSFDLSSIDMKIKLDTMIVTDTLFTEHEEATFGEKYEVSLEQGTHMLDVSSASMNLRETQTFVAENDAYVVVDFIYKQRGTHRYESARQQFDRLSHRDPDSVMKSDTIQIAPTIRIQITDEKPDFLTE